MRFLGDWPDWPTQPWAGGSVGRVIGTAVLSLLVGALTCCGGGSGGSSVAPGRQPTSISPSFTSSMPTPVINWAALPRSPLVLDGPWTSVACESNATLLCVRRNGAPAGAVELLVHPDAHPPGTQPIPYLTQIVADFEKGVAANRQATCANSNAFSAQPVQEVAINGGVGLKSDWSITNSSGLVVERQITYFALGKTTIASLGATALVPGAACVASRGSEFTPPLMAEGVPILDLVAARSRFSSD
ncbi:MAG TPA: hypothetical protein VJ010_02200 [Actinomycetota bacterium]|nr:hypothetical protein [Actinomycetota bacterium]